MLKVDAQVTVSLAIRAYVETGPTIVELLKIIHGLCLEDPLQGNTSLI